MNDTHVLEEQHREDAGRPWWDRELQGLAQRSGSAGNSNHNHVQCTSHAYNYTLSSPLVATTDDKTASHSSVRLYLNVCA